MTTDEKKRKNNRFGPLLIRAECWKDDDPLDGYLLNLSQGGAYMATHSTLIIGDTVRLRISLPWKLGEVKTEAKVVWRSGKPRKDDSETDITEGVGLAFIHLEHEAGEKLQLYMNRFSELAALIEETT